MTRYEPHCDCLGGHVSMVPDPNGRWCRAEVKPLEWDELNDGKAFRALLPIIGSVRVEPYGCCDWWEVLWSMPGQCDKLIPDVFDNSDDAKAAAQAEVERRILSDFVEPIRADEGWQDISTAPKDGTWFLAACTWLRGNEDPPHSDWLRIIRWDVRKGYERYPWAVMDPEGITFGGSICEAIPTHWRPLPAPPSPTEADHA